MNGFQMLFKSLGIDPEMIMQQVNMMGHAVIDVKNQLDRIEAKLDAVLENRLPEKASDKPEMRLIAKG